MDDERRLGSRLAARGPVSHLQPRAPRAYVAVVLRVPGESARDSGSSSGGPAGHSRVFVTEGKPPGVREREVNSWKGKRIVASLWEKSVDSLSSNARRAEVENVNVNSRSLSESLRCTMSVCAGPPPRLRRGCVLRRTRSRVSTYYRRKA